MRPRVARVLAEGWDTRSALGLHTDALLRVLAGDGWQVGLELQNARGVPPAWRGCLNPLAQPPELTILQYPIWFPLAERFRTATGTAIFWYHGVTPPELWSGSERDVLTRSVAGTELAWNAHLAVCDSPFIAEELRRHTGYPADRLRVVPLGVDVARLAAPPPAAQLDRLRREWRLTGRRVLLYVGRVAGNKRVDLLIEALAWLHTQHPDLHLLVAGDTDSLPAYRDLAAQLRQQAAALGVAGRVTFTGRVEDVWPCYHLADVFATASLHEGFGVPLVEAMAAGVPVVASESGALPWVLGLPGEAGAAGLVFPAGDVAALAHSIAQLLDDDGLRERLIARGRARAETFSLAAFASATLAVVSEAEARAQEGPPPGPPTTAADPAARSALAEQADVALRDYRVRSGVPVIGPLIAWLRRNSTTHVKEAYLDRIVEQQVLFNRQLLAELARLEARLARLEQEYPKSTDNEPPHDTA